MKNNLIIITISSLAVISIIAFPLLLTPEFSSNNEELDILFGGDFSFGENYQDRLKEKGETNILEEKGYDYSLIHFQNVLQSSDYVILNLETVLTDLPTSIFEGKKSYIHYSDPEKTASYLKKYNVGAVNLANNHSLDFGEEGFFQTLVFLDKNNIEWFGAGRNGSEASFPMFKTFKVGSKEFDLAVFGTFEHRKIYDEKYHFYASEDNSGVNSFDVDRIISQIQLIKTFDPEMFVVVYPHWGKNYSWKSDEQTKIGHKLIDVGADLILGQGAHKIQEVEYYNGKWIIYNLGNFMFNSPGRYADHDDPPHSMFVIFSISQNDGKISKNLKLYPIFSDNKITNYQPRLLLENEFELTAKKIFEGNDGLNNELMRVGQDDIGYYVELTLLS